VLALWPSSEPRRIDATLSLKKDTVLGS
jgi:hypothetical protein